MADAFILQGRITADNTQAIKGLNETDKKLQETTKGMEQAEKSFASKLGSLATKVGTSMIAVSTAIGTMATKSLVEFENTVAKVSTLVSDKAIPQLSKDMKTLAKNLGMDANLIGEAMYQGLSSGVSEENITEFTEKMGKLAKGGMTDVQTATDLTTTILNSYGMEIGETTKVMDTLIKTQNKGKTTVGELGSSMGKVIPTANALGVDLDNVASAMALATSKGIATARGLVA